MIRGRRSVAGGKICLFYFLLHLHLVLEQNLYIHFQKMGKF